MSPILAVICLVAGFALLVKGADWFVSGASGLARRLGVSPLIIGLTIVAFGTSAPELAVSVTAALDGANEIAVGNVVGSNIFNLLVVAGVSAILCPLVADRTLLRRDWPCSTLAAIILTIMLMFGNNITRVESIILLVLFAGMLVWQIRGTSVPTENNAEEHRPGWLLAVGIVGGIACIVIGGQLSVNGAIELARAFGWSESLIGLTIVAIGTSLPELVTSTVAARRGENEIAMGNVIGSNLFNILGILGISALLNPITVAPTAVFDAALLTVVSLVFWFIARRGTLPRAAGITMVMIYIAYTGYLIVR